MRKLNHEVQVNIFTAYICQLQEQYGIVKYRKVFHTENEKEKDELRHKVKDTAIHSTVHEVFIDYYY